MAGLAFLQPALLWGLTLAGIPILLHLLQRRRYRVRRWAAMEFLRASVRRSSRRLRIEQWLLLMVRTLILLCVALALARPVWFAPQWGWLGSRAASQVVLVLDDSYSLGVRGSAFGDRLGPERRTPNAEPRTSFGWARERALELIRQGLTSGDQVSLVLAGEPARARIRRPTFNLAEVATQVERTPLSDRRTDLAGAARLCREILGSSRAASREVYLFTDAQAIAWQRPEMAEAWKRVAGLARLHVIATPPSRGVNLAVDEVRVSDPVTPGRPASIVARLSNHGDSPAGGVVVTLYADGQAVTSARTQIPASGTAEVRFEHAFPTAGSHTVMVSLPGDSLPADDRGYAALVARERVRVLVLNGHPDPDPRRDAAFFVTAALAPGASGADLTAVPASTGGDGPKPGPADSESPFAVRVIEGSSFHGTDLSQWDVVVLADVPRLGDGERRALAGFVEGGGGLLLLPGPSAVAAFYNGDLLARQPALLPARLGAVRDAGADAPALDLERTDHPALARFRGAADVDLTTARFARYYQLGAPEPNHGGRVVCRFTDAGASRQTSGAVARDAGGRPRSPAHGSLTTVPASEGSPAMVERAVGLGRVALLASPPTPGWNTLPFKPAFLPFLHGLVAYLGEGAGSQRNLRVGDPLISALPQARALSGEKTAAWILEGPDGSRTKLQPVAAGQGQGARPVVHLDAVTWAGLYTLGPAPTGTLHGTTASVSFAVNLRTDESDLRSLSRQELQARLQPAPLRWVYPHESLSTVVREGRHGREAWRGLLFAALALMLCESGMAQLFGRRRGDG